MRSRTKFLAAAVIVTLAGCSSAGVAPKVKMMDGFSSRKPRTIYVETARDRDAVAGGLQRAGFEVTENASSAAYELRVELGSTRKTAPCGTVHNVKYTLGTGAATVLEIKARGWTGSCSPSVYDEMSMTLAQTFPADGAR